MADSLRLPAEGEQLVHGTLEALIENGFGQRDRDRRPNRQTAGDPASSGAKYPSGSPARRRPIIPQLVRTVLTAPDATACSPRSDAGFSAAPRR